MDRDERFTAADPRVKHLGLNGISVENLCLDDDGTVRNYINFSFEDLYNTSPQVSTVNATARVRVKSESCNVCIYIDYVCVSRLSVSLTLKELAFSDLAKKKEKEKKKKKKGGGGGGHEILLL